MTKEQAKLLLPIITAYAEGKTIQMKDNRGDWHHSANPDFTRGPENYRIKSEPKYRPFKNADECWAEMQKHQPLGWVKFNGKKASYIHCGGIEDRGIFYSCQTWSLENMFSDFTFIDGSPFGIKEEGECL